MKKLLALLAFALCPLAAQAQTPGAQPEFCVTSPSQTANYNRACLYASSSGGGIIVTNQGSATGSLIFPPNVAIGTVSSTIPLDINPWPNAASMPAPPAGTDLRLAAPDGNATSIVIDSFNSPSGFVARRMNGTAAAPTQILANSSPLATFQGYGWTSAGAFNPNVNVSIDLNASEAFTATNQGTHIRFRTTPIGDVGPQTTNMVIFQDGGVLIGNSGKATTVVDQTTDPGAHVLDVNQNASLTGVGIPQGGAVIRAAGPDGVSSFYQVDNYAAAGGLLFRRANGTAASKTGVVATNIIGNDIWEGWTSNGAYSPLAAAMQVLATETWTNAANGSMFRFQTTPNGTTTKTNAFFIFQSGGIGVGASVADPGINNIGATGYVVGGTAGASCTLTTVSHLTVVNGIVTLCN